MDQYERKNRNNNYVKISEARYTEDQSKAKNDKTLKKCKELTQKTQCGIQKRMTEKKTKTKITPK